MRARTEPLIIYSLFPRLAGTMSEWLGHAARAARLGFNWIHLNPIQLSGFSQSLYAIKDFYQINPLFLDRSIDANRPSDADDGIDSLRRTIEEMHRLGLRVMLDLVINHTAKDSPLTKEHPSWFRYDDDGYLISPSAIDPADASEEYTWSDLAEIDNAHSTDRQELWAYWTALVQYYLDLGFDGFRCDAAYKVPMVLWQHLIGTGRRKREDTLFVAETLGCRLFELRALNGAGFDCFYNSSKWWNFDEPWCLEQHREFSAIAPSISFPETHDTPRVTAESDGLLRVSRQRYAFAAFFSAGLMMPIGYEFGARRRLDVFRTAPSDWEEPADLRSFVRDINELKRKIPAMADEGRIRALTPLDRPTLLLVKDVEGCPPLYLVVNKNWWHEQRFDWPEAYSLPCGIEHGVIRSCRDGLPREDWSSDSPLILAPAEVIYIY